MEIDTGAGVSIIPFSTWRSHFPDIPLQSSAIQLKTYRNEKLSVLGQNDVTVRYGDQVQKLIITVVDGDGPSLLGRDWLKQLRQNWTQISMVQNSSTQLEDLMKEYSENFRDELGTVRGFQASLHLKGSPQPKFFRPRPVPFVIRDAVGHELDCLVAEHNYWESHSCGVGCSDCCCTKEGWPTSNMRRLQGYNQSCLGNRSAPTTGIWVV